MKRLSYLFSILMLLTAFNFSACKEDVPPVIPDPPGPGPDPELVIPAIDSPGAGKITLAIHVPDGTCKGIVAVGSNGTPELSWDPAGTDFTPVENAEDWYQVTLTFAADMTVKVIAKTKDDKVAWSTQWGMNTVDKNGVPIETNVLFAADDAGCELDETENGGEVKLVSFSDNTVTFIDVKKWKSAPCDEKNKAGTATFKVTVPETTPKTALVSVAGNWGVDGDPEYWAPGAVLMENNGDGTYTLSKEVPAAFEYKYVVSADGSVWDWDYEQLNEQFNMPLNLQADDVVKEWKKEPWNVEPIPGGTGTFTVTITSGYVEGSDIIFTGNFPEKAWIDSDRVMTKEGNVWKWTGDYPENFKCKVMIQSPEGVKSWAKEADQTFDGTNYSFEFSF